VLQPLIDDLNAQISTASNATSGLADAVLADTPAQWNANHGVLSSPRSSLQSASAAVKKARTDLQQIRADLKGARPPATTPTTSA
jgi:multidrug resistance efflux pump